MISVVFFALTVVGYFLLVDDPERRLQTVVWVVLVLAGLVVTMVRAS